MDHQRQSHGGPRLRRSHAFRARGVRHPDIGQHDLRRGRGTQAKSVVRTRHWPALVAATAIVVACAICAGNATAQKNQGPPNALQGFSQNRDEPVKIRAAALELREKDKMATFTGDVYVLQGDTEMRCKQLVVFYEQETETQTVKTVKAADPGPGGDRQIRRIEAKGNVVVTRGADVLRGQRLVVDLTSGVSKMDQGRVEGLFQSGPRNAPDPRNAAEKNNTADKSNTAEKSSSADKR